MIKRLGILRGGRTEYYEPSLKAGGEIFSFILEHLGNKYKPVDILIDEEGVWHISGVPTLPADLMHKVDVVWNTSHPEYGDTLKNFSIPTIGAPRSAHAFKESREMLREHMNKINVNLPRHFIIPQYLADMDGQIDKYAFRKAQEVFWRFGGPWIVKSYPPTEDANGMGVHVAKTFDDLIRAIREGADRDASLEIEELVSEEEAQAHAVGGFRGEDVYVIIPDKVKAEHKEKIKSLVKELYKHIGAEHYLHTGFYIHPKRGVFLKDLGLMPDVKKDSHLYRSGELIGIPTSSIISHMLERAQS